MSTFDNQSMSIGCVGKLGHLFGFLRHYLLTSIAGLVHVNDLNLHNPEFGLSVSNLFGICHDAVLKANFVMSDRGS